jgi:hypothetical protein
VTSGTGKSGSSDGPAQFLVGTGAVLLAAPLVAEAQPAGKVARVGTIFFGPRPSSEELAKGVATNPLWLKMKELGWIEGQNLVVAQVG